MGDTLEMDYINVAKSNKCTLIFNPRYQGHILYFRGESEILFNLSKKSLIDFDKYCKSFTKRILKS